MQLICGECSAQYEAPDELFGNEPRAVRCNRCGYQWTVAPLAGDAPSPPLAAAAAPTLAAAAAAPEARMAEARPAETGAPPSSAAPQPQQAQSQPKRAIADAVTQPLAVEQAGPTAASTRTLLEGHTPPDRPLPAPDPQGRRMTQDDSHISSPPANRDRRAGGISGWGIGLAAMVIVILVIAALSFEPQIVARMPILAHLYNAIGL